MWHGSHAVCDEQEMSGGRMHLENVTIFEWCLNPLLF